MIVSMERLRDEMSRYQKLITSLCDLDEESLESIKFDILPPIYIEVIKRRQSVKSLENSGYEVIDVRPVGFVNLLIEPEPVAFEDAIKRHRNYNPYKGCDSGSHSTPQ